MILIEFVYVKLYTFHLYVYGFTIHKIFETITGGKQTIQCELSHSEFWECQFRIDLLQFFHHKHILNQLTGFNFSICTVYYI